eukprot:4726648-Amphidinium_carterae.1
MENCLLWFCLNCNSYLICQEIRNRNVIIYVWTVLVAGKVGSPLCVRIPLDYIPFGTNQSGGDGEMVEEENSAYQ